MRLLSHVDLKVWNFVVLRRWGKFSLLVKFLWKAPQLLINVLLQDYFDHLLKLISTLSQQTLLVHYEVKHRKRNEWLLHVLYWFWLFFVFPSFLLSKLNLLIGFKSSRTAPEQIWGEIFMFTAVSKVKNEPWTSYLPVCKYTEH